MPNSRAIPLVFALMLAALVLPVLATPMPPLFDYPNHLARLWLIGGGVAVPPVSSMYAIEWSALTNIGIDLLAVPLTRLFSAEAVGKLYLGAGLVLAPLGVAMLHRALYGRLNWWVLAFPLLAWNGAVLAGFLNFQLGLGLALLLAAVDPALAQRGAAPVFLWRLGCAALLLLVHVFALVFYAALLCGLALGAEIRPLLRRGGPWAAALRLLPVLAAVGLAFAAFLLAAPALPGAHEAAGTHSLAADFAEGFRELLYRRKAKSALSWMWTYNLAADAAMLLLALLPLALARWRLHAGLLLVAVALGLLFVVTPFRLAGTYWIDRRFVFMAPLVLAAALRPELPARFMRGAAVLLACLCVVRTGFIGGVWQLRQADVRAVEQVLAEVPPGAAVLPVQHTPLPWVRGPLGRFFGGGEPSFGHYPALALPERLAFTPTIFTARGKQPLRVLPPWDEIAVPEGWLVSVNTLSNLEVRARVGWVAPYVNVWRERFDYVLVVNADLPDMDGEFTPPPGLVLTADAGFAQLWRVVRAAPEDQVSRAEQVAR